MVASAELELLAQRGRLRLDEPAKPTAAPKALLSLATSLGLTRREVEVLTLVAASRTNRQIGQELFITPKTAGVHVSRILAKLGVASRGEAAAVAHRLGLDKQRLRLGVAAPPMPGLVSSGLAEADPRVPRFWAVAAQSGRPTSRSNALYDRYATELTHPKGPRSSRTCWSKTPCHLQRAADLPTSLLTSDPSEPKSKCWAFPLVRAQCGGPGRT
jgi:DNA-binding CsgD family transcriptional regulator